MNITRKSVPHRIIVVFNDQLNQYGIIEDRTIKTGKRYKTKTQFYDKLQDYIFPPEYDGTVLIGLFSIDSRLPRDAMVSIDLGAIRKSKGIPKGNGISIEVSSIDLEKMTAEIDIYTVDQAGKRKKVLKNG